MKNLIFILIIFFSVSSAQLPRFIDWENTGLTSKIEYLDTLFLDLNEFVDISEKINSTIKSLSNSTLIVIPEGTYVLSNPISLKSNIGIKGESIDKTKIIIETRNAFNITGKLGKEISFIKLPNTYSDTLITNYDLILGDFLVLDIENGDWDTSPIDWANRSVGQQFKIKKVINDSTYLLNNKLKFATDTSAVLKLFTPIENVTVSCLHLLRENQPSSVGYNIYLNYAFNCKINNIFSEKGDGAQVMLYNSFHCEVKDSYFYDSFEFNGSGTKGYGVTCASKTSYCRIENNIFRMLRHAMMVKQGANSNAFAYNYSFEVNRSEPISDFTGDISIHGHYPFYNLFESNVVQNIIIDHYWGQGGYFNTFLRNRVERYGIITTLNENQTMNQNFIGNEMTAGFSLINYYSIAGEGHLEIGNVTPRNILQDSVGLYSYNSFLYKDFTPLIGLPNSLSENEIPAEKKYNLEGYMNCEEIILSVNSKNDIPEIILLIVDLNGNSVVFENKDFDNKNFNEVLINLKPGYYIIKTNLNTHKIYKK